MSLKQESSNNLKWLFVATFADGTTIAQTQEDKSLTEEGKSAITDVWKRDDLVNFALHHVDGQQTVLVDLKVGYFVVNGVPVVAHNQYFEPERYPLELVYFREVRAHQDVIATVQDDGSVDVGDPHNQVSYINRYFLGWKTTVNGKDKQVTIAVG